MKTRCICGIVGRKGWGTRGWGTRGWGTRSVVSSQVAVVFRRSTLFIARLRVLHTGWDDDFQGQLFVDRRDEVTAAAIVEDADHGFLFALHYADDPAFSLAVMPEAAHFHQHLVTMHGVADNWRRNKDVALQLALDARREGAGFGDDKAKAVAMHT